MDPHSEQIQIEVRGNHILVEHHAEGLAVLLLLPPVLDLA
jgi:hypothetical protein